MMTVEQAEKILRPENGKCSCCNDFYGLDKARWWKCGIMVLDGEYTLDELEAMVVWCRAQKEGA